MPFGNQNCKTCSHPDVGVIDSLIARSVPSSAIARRFALSRPSIARHRKNHIDPNLLRRLKARALRGEQAGDLEEIREDESAKLLFRISHTRARLNALLDAAEKAQDWRGAIAAVRALHENFELVARLIGELNTGTQIVNQSLVLAPDYLRLRALLIDALRPFPAARIAVAKALRQVEGENPEQKKIEVIRAGGETTVPPSVEVIAAPSVIE